MAQSNDDLLNFVNDPETLKRAAEGSMGKRLEVMAQSITKLCPTCRKVRVTQDVDVCAACSNKGRGAQSNGDSVTVDGDLYYNENIKQVGDLGVFIDEVDKLAKLAEAGRINDMRRELVNFVVQDRKQHELEARLEGKLEAYQNAVSWEESYGHDPHLSALAAHKAAVSDVEYQLAELKSERERLGK